MYQHRLTTPPALRNDRYVKLLLRGDSLADASLAKHTVTNNSVSVVTPGGTNAPSGIAKALYFRGDISYLTIPYTTDFDFGNLDFTVDAWICPSGSFTNNYALLQQYLDGNNRMDFLIYGGYGLRAQHERGGAQYYAQGTCSFSSGIWTHLAWVRLGGVMRIYKDGVAIPLNANTLTGAESFCVSTSAPYHIGLWSVAPYYFPGQIANLRISKGFARWTRDFTPPRRPY
ncbi:hypothetical protein JCM15519_03970 [Fundidesulfovibrio butyratiphilus]